MSTRLKKYWESFRSSFWFTPTLMAALSAVLAFGTISMDHNLPEPWRRSGWIYGGGPEGARAVLSVIASSMITVAGVVFSITIVALTLASSQFGPRLLRNFMRDTANQIVLGTFIATFLYCLLVLRTIRGVNDREFVPHVSVTAGVLLGLASLGVLIYFIHHVAVSIQASYILSTVSHELSAAIDRLFPDELGKSSHEVRADEDGVDVPADASTCWVRAKQSGYVQAIDNERILEIASEHDLVVNLFCRPGRFVIVGTDIASIAVNNTPKEELEHSVLDTFIIGSERNSTQDVEFVVSQLVEVALRALSPGINDPYTAISCIDWLAVGLCQLAGRELPSKRRFDSDGNLRIVAETIQFAEVLDLALNQIRQAGQSHPAIRIRLMEALAYVAQRARRMSDIQTLRNHAQLIWQCTPPELMQGSDRSTFECAYKRVQRVLNEGVQKQS